MAVQLLVLCLSVRIFHHFVLLGEISPEREIHRNILTEKRLQALI